MRRTGIIVIAIALSAGAVACEPGPARWATQNGVSYAPKLVDANLDPITAMMRAHDLVNAGFHTPAERDEYVMLVEVACERGHDGFACVEAAAVTPDSARTLLYHGCTVGSVNACVALMKSEIEHDHEGPDEARMDVEEALATGCEVYKGTSCEEMTNIDATLTAALFPPEALEEARAKQQLVLAYEECRDACPMLKDDCRARCKTSALRTCASNAPLACAEIN